MLISILLACSGEAPTSSPQNIPNPPPGIKSVQKSQDNSTEKRSFELLGCKEGDFRQPSETSDIECVKKGLGASLVSVQISLPPAESNNGLSGVFMMQTEVTQGFYQTVMQKNPVLDCEKKLNKAIPDPGQPLYCISFAGAAEFANTLSTKVGLRPCYSIETDKITLREGLKCSGYRLPTLIEWRLSIPQIDEGGMGNFAWYAPNAQEKTHIVAQKQPNTNNIYDGFGNVSEWIWKDEEGGPFSEVLSGEKRMNIGGSAGDIYVNLQFEAGRNLQSDSIDEGTGFRLLRSIQ